ncbi:hypothetical protein IQ07DRAFT_601660 [Pyrenochaeta sp. DS3sAY3a]|nr:hypothetical protein IQ07DRAFT_601660 [Pyrenochaeta sp. DS3sAY3a]
MFTSTTSKFRAYKVSRRQPQLLHPYLTAMEGPQADDPHPFLDPKTYELGDEVAYKIYLLVKIESATPSKPLVQAGFALHDAGKPPEGCVLVDNHHSACINQYLSDGIRSCIMPYAYHREPDDPVEKISVLWHGYGRDTGIKQLQRRFGEHVELAIDQATSGLILAKWENTDDGKIAYVSAKPDYHVWFEVKPVHVRYEV